MLLTGDYKYQEFGRQCILRICAVLSGLTIVWKGHKHTFLTPIFILNKLLCWNGFARMSQLFASFEWTATFVRVLFQGLRLKLGQVSPQCISLVNGLYYFTSWLLYSKCEQKLHFHHHTLSKSLSNVPNIKDRDHHSNPTRGIALNKCQVTFVLWKQLNLFLLMPS